MKVQFRGGPKDRKRMLVEDNTTQIEVQAPVSNPFSISTHLPSPVAFEIKRGRYSRTFIPNKNGVYYMVWMGWDE